MKVSYSLIFDRKDEITKKNHEKGLIQIQVYLNGKRRYFSTKIYVTPKEWDKKKRVLKDHHFKVMLQIIKGEQPLTDANKKFAGMNLQRLKNYGFEE